MKNLIVFFLLLGISTINLYANCSSGGDNCANAKSVTICGTQTFVETLSASSTCTNSVSSWSGPSGTINNTTKDLFYAVTINQDPSATTLPTSINFTVRGTTSTPIFTIFAMGTSCNSGTYIDSYTSSVANSGLCEASCSFPISPSGASTTYYFALESAEDFTVLIGGITGTSTATVTIPPTSGYPGCAEGTLTFGDISACAGRTAFKTAKPYYELCLNGSVVSTNQWLTFNLSGTNQLCIRTNLENVGASNFNVVDFNFGPDIVNIKATNNSCSGATAIAPYSTQPAQHGGSGTWQVSSFSASPTPAAYIPTGVTVDKRISWVFNNGTGRGDNTSCNYSCKVYEFCFELEANSNDPAKTKVVGVFYPNDYSYSAVPAVPGGTKNVTTTYGCVNLSKCSCPIPVCFQRGYLAGGGGGGGTGSRTPLVIDFEDPASASGPLPVEMLSFSGKSSDMGDELHWVTASEENNSHFEIEWSANGNDFQSIGEVKGAGNSVEKRQYKFLNANLINGTNYYRLKQVDFDGAFEYSKIITVSSEKQSDFVLYPTVSKSHIMLEANTIQHPITYTIYSGVGKKILKNNTSETHTNINIQSLSAGQYFMRVEQAGNIEILRFIKQP